MSSFAQIDWRVDTRAYDELLDHIVEKYGIEDHAAGQLARGEIITAMEEFLDQDRFVEIEEMIGQLDATLADRIGGFSRRRTSRSDPLVDEDFGGDETTLVRHEIPMQLKEEFASYIKEHSEWGLGEALGRALRAHLDGGRAQRPLGRLDAMIQKATRIGEDRPHSEDGKVSAIIDALIDDWGHDSASDIEGATREDFADYIHTFCSRGDRGEATDRTVRKYIGLVTDEIGLVPHPTTDGLFVPSTDSDDSACLRLGYEQLSQDERVKAVRLKLIRKAAQKGGDYADQAGVTATQIRDEFFDGAPSEAVAHKLRDLAAEAEGFGTKAPRGGGKLVRVILDDIGDSELLNAAGITPSEELERSAAEEMDVLANASPVRADGGYPE